MTGSGEQDAGQEVCKASGQYILCPDCDKIYRRSLLDGRQTARCSCCGAHLYGSNSHMVDKTLAFSLAGLLFYIPANILPILTFAILGVDSTNTMLNGVEQLFMAGYWWMSFLVLMCSVLVPLINLLMLFGIALQLKLQAPQPGLSSLLLWQAKIEEWAMLEVYLLGIVVAYVKMLDMGDVIVGAGLYCFVGMMLAAVLASHIFDTEAGFDMAEAMSGEKSAPQELCG